MFIFLRNICCNAKCETVLGNPMGRIRYFCVSEKIVGSAKIMFGAADMACSGQYLFGSMLTCAVLYNATTPLIMLKQRR
jgi:hypothetical protein